MAQLAFARSVVHLLANAVECEPRREALVCGDMRLTYAEYGAAVAGLAIELGRRQVGGGRVVLLMGNSAEHAIAAFAIQAAGAQLVPLNPSYTVHELADIIADADPCLIVHDAAVGPILDQLPTKLAACPRTIPDVRRATAPGDNATIPLPEPDQRALLQYTGGTSGRAKGVELTHAAVAANVAQREAVLPTSAADRVLVMTPLYHSYASAMGLNLAARAAATLVILPRFKPELAMELVAKERISLFCGSPTIFNAILSHPQAAHCDWSSLRLCYSGSAALPAATLARWESLTGCSICEGYGQTEAGPVLTYNPQSGVRKPGTVGPSLPETTIEIVDADTGERRLPPAAAGEIRARGPQIMLGYSNRPDETAAALRNGWLYTGDIGFFDSDGYLVISDRKKDVVIVSGYNVFPREVEEALVTHSVVAEAAVVGRPDAHRGEALVAFVVLSSNAAQSPSDELREALETYLASRLVRYKIPRDIRFADALPKTAVGKTDKVELKRRAAAD